MKRLFYMTWFFLNNSDELGFILKYHALTITSEDGFRRCKRVYIKIQVNIIFILILNNYFLLFIITSIGINKVAGLLLSPVTTR